VEVRGAVGGPVLVSGIEGDRVCLLLPRERRAAIGRVDDSSLWREEIGFPFSGRVLLELARPVVEDGGAATVSDWHVKLGVPPPGERLPSRLEADGEDGARLVLEKTSERPARGVSTWPKIPESFERREYRR